MRFIDMFMTALGSLLFLALLLVALLPKISDAAIKGVRPIAWFDSEEPLRSACVPGMTVAENMALRTFDRPPIARGPWLLRGPLRAQAERWIAEFRVQTEGPDASMATLSGGNVQRAPECPA